MTEAETTNQEPETRRSKDGRLKLSLSEKSSPHYLATKADLERIEGRELTTDEVVRLLVSFVDISSPDRVSAHVSSTLKELERYLEEHREILTAGCVSLFREAILDVMRGRTPARNLSEALIDAR